MLQSKHILLGITGGIAAYKICTLIRNFKKSGAEVKIIATPNALNFVTKLTLQNLSQSEVYVEEFDVNNWKPEHISLADWADIMLIAPATANTISKIAQGIADNLLTSVACAFSKKMIIAPAMNVNMWNNDAVQNNLKILQKRGIEILEPESGFLACGYMGKGRLCSLDKIYNAVEEALNYSQMLKGQKVVITAGGTIEEIDPVRYISNYSSGKMGLALAKSAQSMGAEVVFITTKYFDVPFKKVMVKSAQDMQNAINEEFDTANYIIMAAAVADYRVKEYSEQKIKKENNDSITLELVKNPDILADLCKNKTSQTIVGFCAESENLMENAKTKIEKKGCDYLVANDISRKDIGFNSDENEVTILSQDGSIKKISKAPKNIIARKIWECISTK
ncbi:bifunctional phosphopantothenoylcysteine decarboxylase/phosphopantothenate--cysteine ligase CoaBC [bacterium]|nr:bifunctional phosphopantothenoylcysteine decarboxylase/phosphopantothenate--cysteine ligase CoaBC [bacterium]